MRSYVRQRPSASHVFVPIFALWLASGVVAAQPAEGDPERGARHFRACIACHSIAPGEHLTGPSLNRIFGSKAGTVEGFGRYSPALKSSAIVWTTEALDAWLTDPERLVPKNSMTFRGIRDADVRADLIAFLRATGAKSLAEAQPTQEPRVSRRLSNLKQAKADSLVKSIYYCGDAYRIHTQAGEEFAIWEFNLRIKTDSSANGPRKGQPALLPAGMQGDRASIIFSDPAEISPFIRRSC
ncbi:MAG: c-type cytochrome [Betaproteobacteria bacterium]|nr:c-type cytochrome [Betaproteobacteria bacterium]